MRDRIVRTSKLLSYVLRHRPEAIGIDLDGDGWADVDALLEAVQRHGTPIDRALLDEVVQANAKQRFALSANGRRIRARQGHSISVDLGLRPEAPPSRLYHGTARHVLDSILSRGLVRGRRQHVHLSLDAKTAVAVGRRHGTPVVLVVAAGSMHEAGHRFYRSENGVWLTEHVPPGYLTLAS